MPQQNNSSQASPFEIVTSGKSKKAGKTGLIVGVTIVVFLILSVVAGVLLVRQQQTVTPQAGGNSCPAAEACPWGGGSGYAAGTLLRSCHPGLNNNTVVDESVCNQAGRVQTCGPATTKYCCPKAGGVWTTDMTACNGNPTPTPNTQTDPNNCGTVGSVCPAGTTCVAGACTSPTPVPTATPALTPTPVGSGSGNSCNGTCGSNSNCQSGLYCYSGFCRNPLCASDSTCGCGASPTPTPTATAVSTTTTTQTTPLPIPVTGYDWPTVAGLGVGASAIIVSLLLAL